MAAAPLPTPLEEAVARVGDRWTLLIVDALLPGPRRFGDLADRLGGIAPNVLTKRLRRLEADGLVVSVPYQRRPPRLAYELTGPGRDLAGARHCWRPGVPSTARPGPGAFHPACGSPVETRLWCPTCDRPVDDDEPTWEISL